MTAVPKQYVGDVKAAAKATGLPVPVVAAQINLESRFNPNVVSPTGAEGIAQFEPGTWATWGHGSPFNVADAFKAYAAYMSALLKEEDGSVRDALAAYNAGPGDIQAGLGYADEILAAAGEPDTIRTPGGAAPAPGSGGGGGVDWNLFADADKGVGDLLSSLGDATGLGAVAGAIGAVAKDVEGLSKLVTWLLMPSNWARIFAGIMGAGFLGAGIFLLGREAKTS